ncbi:MAG: hypothetical protein BMS9Abin01_1467 [Gammaproteobacteria bacterium]|nr:MAG: hypothetical protein BMS9Abin01_1467 [Gammaproteobacteria bacterium]
MASLVRFMLRSRTHAISVAVIGMLLPPFSFVTGGIIGVAVLRYGLADGALVLAASMAVSTLAMGLLLGTYQPVVIFVLFTGLPILLLAQVLRQTDSQGTTLTAAGALGAVVLVGIHLLTADPVAWWRAKLERFVAQPIREANPDLAPEMLKQLDQAMQGMSMLMLSLPAATVVGAMLVLWLARWMHATLDNPGGFGKEFRALRMDQRVAFAGVALALLAIFAGNFAGGLFRGLLVLVIVVYTIQGIALVHAVVHKRGASVAWLVAVYAGIVIMPPAAILGLALTGFSDAWFDFRRRWGASV